MLSKKQILSELLEADLAAEDLALVTALQAADRAEEAIQKINQNDLQSKIMAAVSQINLEDIKAECAAENAAESTTDKMAKLKKTANINQLLWAQKNKNYD